MRVLNGGVIDLIRLCIEIWYFLRALIGGRFDKVWELWLRQYLSCVNFGIFTDCEIGWWGCLLCSILKRVV